MSVMISASRVFVPRFGSAQIKTPLESVREYYHQVDANQFDTLLERFDDTATYEREGWAPLIGKPAISNFFKKERTLRGIHALQSIQSGGPDEFVKKYSTGPTIYAQGEFDGKQDEKPIHLKFQDFWAFRPQGDKVVFRKSWIQFPKGPAVKV